MSQVQTTHPRSLSCAICGDVIGVYEPAVVVEDGTPRHTSLAAEPHPHPRPATGRAWHHRTCFADPRASAAAPAVA